MSQEVIKPEMGKNAAGEDVYMFTAQQLQSFISRIVGQALPEPAAPSPNVTAEGPPPGKADPLSVMKGLGGK